MDTSGTIYSKNQLGSQATKALEPPETEDVGKKLAPLIEELHALQKRPDFGKRTLIQTPSAEMQNFGKDASDVSGDLKELLKRKVESSKILNMEHKQSEVIGEETPEMEKGDIGKVQKHIRTDWGAMQKRRSHVIKEARSKKTERAEEVEKRVDGKDEVSHYKFMNSQDVGRNEEFVKSEKSHAEEDKTQGTRDLSDWEDRKKGDDDYAESSEKKKGKRSKIREEKISRKEKKEKERKEKSEDESVFVSILFGFFHWISSGDIIVRLIVGIIAGILAFGYIFSQMGLF